MKQAILIMHLGINRFVLRPSVYRADFVKFFDDRYRANCEPLRKIVKGRSGMATNGRSRRRDRQQRVELGPSTIRPSTTKTGRLPGRQNADRRRAFATR
jgi:hypothetical protein